MDRLFVADNVLDILRAKLVSTGPSTYDIVSYNPPSWNKSVLKETIYWHTIINRTGR